MAAASLLLTFVAIELALIAIGFSDRSLYQFDGIRGYAYRPKVEELQEDGEGGESVSLVTNRFGFRDSDRSLEKPPGVIRIAVLGDSFTVERKVSSQNRFTEVMDRQLNQQDGEVGGGRFEVLNFGVASYGTGQELLTLQHVVSRFEPDVVLLAFYPSNDVSTNSNKFQPDNARPYFSLHEGDLVLDRSFYRAWKDLYTRWLIPGGQFGARGPTGSGQDQSSSGAAAVEGAASSLGGAWRRSRAMRSVWTARSSLNPRGHGGKKLGTLPNGCWSKHTARPS